jgi:hypothetical protein
VPFFAKSWGATRPAENVQAFLLPIWYQSQDIDNNVEVITKARHSCIQIKRLIKVHCTHSHYGNRGFVECVTHLGKGWFTLGKALVANNFSANGSLPSRPVGLSANGWRELKTALGKAKMCHPKKVKINSKKKFSKSRCYGADGVRTRNLPSCQPSLPLHHTLIYV